MSEYYNFDNFNNFDNFSNNESEDLDKLARQINNKKTSLVKKVTDDYNIQQNKWKNGIDNLTNNNKYSFLPMNKNNVTNYDNKYQTNNKPIYQDFEDSSDNFSVDNSLFSSDLIDSESIDLYLNEAKDCKKNNLTNFKNIVNSISYDECSKDDNNIFDHIKKCQNCKKNNLTNFKNIVNSISYDECSKDDNNIFDHIKKCQNCKNKLIKYLNITINNETNNETHNEINNNEKKIFNFKLNKLEQLSIKEIIVIIMIGIFIIIVLDLLFGIKKK